MFKDMIKKGDVHVLKGIINAHENYFTGNEWNVTESDIDKVKLKLIDTQEIDQVSSRIDNEDNLTKEQKSQLNELLEALKKGG